MAQVCEGDTTQGVEPVEETAPACRSGAELSRDRELVWGVIGGAALSVFFMFWAAATDTAGHWGRGGLINLAVVALLAFTLGTISGVYAYRLKGFISLKKSRKKGC